MDSPARHPLRSALSSALLPALVGALAGLSGSGSRAGEAPAAHARKGQAPGPGCAPEPPSPERTSVKLPAYGAVGDGKTDDTAAIQRAINAVAGSGGTVFIPDGTYLINPTAVDGRKGLVLGSRMTLRLAPHAVLKALPSSAKGYAIVEVASVSQVTIVGGTLAGDRDVHQGTGGEWGMGLDINHAEDVVVQDVVARDCWGDGFYIGISSKAIKLCHVTADHNRRQGLSITGVDGLLVKDCLFENTAGTPGESGLDIEPNDGQTVRNVLITDSTFYHNGGEGLSTGVPVAHTGRAFTYGIVIEGNTVKENGLSGTPRSIRSGIEVSNAEGTQVSHNVIQGNRGRGILIRGRADKTLCTGNQVTGTVGPPGDGIVEDSCADNTITGNTITGNQGQGISSAGCRGSVIKDNALAGNRKAP